LTVLDDKYETTWDLYRQFMFAKDEGVDAVTRPTRPYVRCPSAWESKASGISMTNRGE